jgi:glucans biosynthesis protein
MRHNTQSLSVHLLLEKLESVARSVFMNKPQLKSEITSSETGLSAPVSVAVNSHCDACCSCEEYLREVKQTALTLGVLALIVMALGFASLELNTPVSVVAKEPAIGRVSQRTTDVVGQKSVALSDEKPKVESVKTDAPKTEPVKTESPKIEPAKTEQAAPQIGSFVDLVEYARVLSLKDFMPVPEAPAVLRDMDYDTYRLISFRNNRSVEVKQKSPYWLEMFHKGFVQQGDVRMNMIEEGVSHAIPFKQDFFDYRGKLDGKLKLPENLGFAGLKVVGRYPDHDNRQEMITFLGASYFRAIAEANVYGSSARGLAIDVGLPKAEEFPAFREFWVIPTNTSENQLRLLALMESPSVTGAYEFVFTPGAVETKMAVQSVLYFRKVPEKVGLAPITSMWMWGDGLDAPVGDGRPEVHDADGLLIQSENNDWTWRALCRQIYPSVVRMELSGIHGFGLMQRDTQNAHFLDDEAKYDRRPSIWIQPHEGFGAGALELLELPAPHEGIDNIAVWWVPREQIQVQTPFRLKYDVTFTSGDRTVCPLGRAVAHRVIRNSKEDVVIEVDFTQPSTQPDALVIKDLVLELQTIRAEVTSSQIKLKQADDKNKQNLLTAEVHLKPVGEVPIELTTFLQHRGTKITETWKYLCPVESPPVSIPPWRLDHHPKEKQP